MNLVQFSSAFLVFLGIGAIGFLFLLVSLLFGGIFDHFDGGLDHDLDHGGPGFLSTRVMSVFITAFGGVGAIATHFGFTPLPASSIGAISGLVIATPVYYFARFLYGQQATSELLAHDLVGRIGRVVVTIPAGGIGQVRVKLGEELVDKIARGREPLAIAENTSVIVEEVLGETIIVKKQ
jgi:membrane protein implicated in regulation of membrane protease activity